MAFRWQKSWWVCLLKIEILVTVLGREPIEGAAFLKDSEEFAGPLAALAAFHPRRPFVLVVSCDLPLFDPRVVPLLRDEIGEFDAAIPVADRRLQPLCGLYRSRCFEIASAALREGRRSVFAWVERLSVREIPEKALTAAWV